MVVFVVVSHSVLYFILQNLMQGRGNSTAASYGESLSHFETKNARAGAASLGSDRRAGSSSTTGYKKDESNWRYDNDETSDVNRASAALENLQLDRKTRNLTSSWSHAGDGDSENDGRMD
ncbi:hypothetical protein Leryth_012466 [Lithospermum erythrorhizon]|nr:hypothetical protein Leryth_012466 [Lithospermum erythrorhizon]